MRPKVSVYLAVSADNFIAGEGHDLDWLEHDSKGEDYGYNQFMKSVDMMVMGRGTFEKILEFKEWPYEGRSVIVLSRSLKPDDLAPVLREQVELLDKAPEEVLRYVEALGCKHIYLDGVKTVHEFLKQGLVNEMTLTVFPLLLGKGIPLFHPKDRQIPMKLLDLQRYESGIYQVKYQIGE